MSVKARCIKTESPNSPAVPLETTMKDPARSKNTVTGSGAGDAVKPYKRDFWDKENLKYGEPHLRAQKVARLINKIARGKECDLLDIGCGPAGLRVLLDENIRYHGIDIAIHDPAPNLIQADLVENPIEFNGKRFDIVVAQGAFEYFGEVQSQKFDEIKKLLADDGTFIVSYWNFGHRNARIYEAFSNIQPLNDFRESLASYFKISSSFPASHNWKHNMSDRRLLKAVNAHVNMNIPFVSPRLAVEYLFICYGSGSS
jgi:cyclopropane fatty-acyl-phospholipid synthase-like methyltransferase